jgi:hypothetical protein
MHSCEARTRHRDLPALQASAALLARNFDEIASATLLDGLDEMLSA